MDRVYNYIMKTIPLDPIFENEKFNQLKPGMKFYLINIVYKLCRNDKQSQPLPKSINVMLECSTASYDRHKHTFYDILNEVLPKIDEIKRLYGNRAAKAHSANSKKAILQRKEKDRNKQFSDEKVNHCEINPVPPPPGKNQYHQGQYDHVARKQAIESNKDKKDVWFTDG